MDHGSCLALLRLIWGTPKQRPPVDSGDVRRKYGARGWHGIPMRAAHIRTALTGGGTGFYVNCDYLAPGAWLTLWVGLISFDHAIYII